MLQVEITKKTDAGTKKNNQDACYSEIKGSRVFAIIADGVTTLDAGERASNFVVESYKNWIKKKYDENWTKAILIIELEALLKEIHENLTLIGEDEDLKLGSTASLVIMTKTRLIVAQIGDSRIYIKQDKNIRQVTIDQTVLNYEKLTGQKIDSIEEDKKEHTLMQCLGRGNASPYIGDYELGEEVEVLLCSDGLTNSITDMELFNVLNAKNKKDKLEELIKRARKEGEEDNITGILIKRTIKEEK